MHRWLLKLLFSSKEEFQLGYVHTACELTPLPPALSNYEAPPVVPPRIRGASFVDRGHSRTISDVSYASSTSSQSTGKYLSMPSLFDFTPLLVHVIFHSSSYSIYESPRQRYCKIHHYLKYVSLIFVCVVWSRLRLSIIIIMIY